MECLGTQLEQQYPVWAQNFTSGVRQTNRQQAIQTLTQIFKNGDAPAGEQTESVQFLLQQYQGAAAAYNQASQSSNYSKDEAEVEDSWVQYLDSLAKEEPSLKPVIQSVFKDALKVDT